MQLNAEVSIGIGSATAPDFFLHKKKSKQYIYLQEQITKFVLRRLMHDSSRHCKSTRHLFQVSSC